ncbi:MAG: hypothetical protein JKX97_02050 [Candidatus Lindowbacteria bacterium]|nr:hypothetical protein [Candidatus Lindowbacteria bacterium]
MREFAPNGRALARFNLPMKISLTCFLLLTLLGLATSVALYHQQFEFDSQTAGEYYRGNEDDLDAEVFLVEKSYRQLLEVTHFHLYIMPIVYLALIHLYFLSTRSEKEKIIVTVITFGSVLLEIATPWLIRYVSVSFSPSFWISGIGLSLGTVWITFITIKEMWSSD